MKKALMILLSLALTLTLAACGGDGGGKAPAENSNARELTEASASQPTTDGISIDEIVGIYEATLKSDWPEGPREQATEIKLVKRDGQLEFDKGLFIILKKMPFDYDKNTSTAICVYEHPDGTTTTETFVFTKENEGIRISGTSTGTAGTVFFDGYKVD